MRALVELKQSFLKDLEIRKGRSQKTIENYDRYLEKFLTHANVRIVSQLTEERVISFIPYLQRAHTLKEGVCDKPMKPQTQNYHLSALRMFLRFLRTEGYDVPSPNVVVRNTLQPVLPKRLLPEDVARFSFLSRPKTAEDMRDHALIMLLLETGLRTAEICALSRTDVDLHLGEITMKDKYGHESVLHLSRPAVRALALYMEVRDDKSDALFIRYGRKMHDGGDRRIHPRAVQRLIKKYARLVGVTPVVTVQMLRGSIV